MSTTFFDHVSSFVDVKHTNRKTRGYTRDENGCLWATDGIMLLKTDRESEGVSGFHDLKHRHQADLEPLPGSSLNRLVLDLPEAAELDVQELRNAVKMLGSIGAVLGVENLLLTAENERLCISFKEEESGSSGHHRMDGIVPGASFEKRMNAKRLLTCLDVFKEVDKVKLFVGSDRIQLQAAGVTVILLCIRKY